MSKNMSRPADKSEFGGPTTLQDTGCMDDSEHNPMFLDGAQRNSVSEVFLDGEGGNIFLDPSLPA